MATDHNEVTRGNREKVESMKEKIKKNMKLKRLCNVLQKEKKRT